jgi:hypothetical protein
MEERSALHERPRVSLILAVSMIAAVADPDALAAVLAAVRVLANARLPCVDADQ